MFYIMYLTGMSATVSLGSNLLVINHGLGVHGVVVEP
jgi:hypothetical protein